jgi:hypothetical protein
MVGICIHEGTWYALEKRVLELKRGYSTPGVEIELHAKDFCVSFREQSEIEDFELLDWSTRRSKVRTLRDEKIGRLSGAKKKSKLKTHRSTDPFVHLTRAERSRLLEDGLDLVGSHDGVRLFGEVVDKQYLGDPDVVGHAFTQIIARFEAFLNYYNKNTPVNKGLLVMDHEPTYERLITELFLRYRDQGHPWGKIEHVIEAPFFVDSKRAYAVQAVDLCSYAVRRYVERADTAGGPEETNFLRIFHKFDRAGPKLHGLRHYCKSGTYHCLICKARGHDQI